MPDIFEAVPIAEMRESIEYLTDVITCRSAEVRNRVRERAIRRLTVTYPCSSEENFSDIKKLFIDNAQSEWRVPWWSEVGDVGDVSAAQSVFQIDDSDKEYRAGDEFIVTDFSGYEVLETLSADFFVLTATTATAAGYDDAAVVPLKNARVDGLVQFTRREGLIVDYTITWRTIDEHDFSSQEFPAEPDGLLLFNEASEYSGEIGETISRAQENYDNGIGAIETWDTETYNRHNQTVSMIQKGRSGRLKVKGFLNWLRGRHVAFWLPTFSDETVAPEKTKVRSSVDRFDVNYNEGNSCRVDFPVSEVLA